MASIGERFDSEVTVAQVRFAADDGGFAVLAAEVAGVGEVTLAGPLSHLERGDRARVKGSWQRHPRYGRQVRVSEALALDPDDRSGMLGYLKTVRHVGKRRAELLLERHGPALFEAIDADPERAFAALRGVGPAAAREAAASWRERRAVRELHLLLGPHGLARLAPELGERYGAGAAALLRDDPYRLTELHGVGFPSADRIARAAGVPTSSARRHHAAVVHLLAEAEAEGHTHLPLPTLERRARSLVGSLPRQRLLELESAKRCLIEREAVYRAPTHRAERSLAGTLAGLAASPPALELNVPEQPQDGLSREQWAAVRAAFRSRLSLITGGPGTGKTTLAKAIVRLAEQAELRIALCAPTGRAARRLAEATGRQAQTIHRLLDWTPGLGPMHDRSHPLRRDLLLVDECSMINLATAGMLLDAVGPATHVVWVGDADQLPPVGAGKPFADLIASHAAPVCRLTHVFRQAARSLLVGAAHAINRGERPTTEARPGQLRDFFFCARDDVEHTADAIIELATQRLPLHYRCDPLRDVQVLAPIYRGPAGINALNERLRAQLNPHGEPCLGDRLRRGDKLIQTRNDYATGLMNGQLVLLTDDHPDTHKLQVETDDGRRIAVPYDCAATLRPAYAISVHKAQGCEIPLVVLAVHGAHAVLLSRNLLYTGVTRARTACALVGERRALDQALRQADAHKRYSGLAERIARQAA